MKVDFGDILNDWEIETAKPYGKKRLKDDSRRETAEEKKAGSPVPKSLPRAHPVDIWMRRYGIQDKDTDAASEKVSPAERRHALHALKSEAVIDLHGLTREDAWVRLESFFADCRRRGLQKILIIHGKGTHSGSGSVLQQMVKVFIEENPNAGESGYSKREDGGSGSTWVLLK